MIDHILKQIENNLEKFLTKVNDEFDFQNIHPNLYQHIREYCLRKGKRIRPLLLILFYKGYSPQNARTSSSIYYAATCMELLHNFMLIHDDIIDKADLRRNKPTMHRLLEKSLKSKAPESIGNDLGIIAGDIIYALAIDAFLNIREDPIRKEQALKFFVQTAAFTAIGEFIDTLHGISPVDTIKEKDVYLNYTLKTARYTFVCPMIIGAILAGTNKKEIKFLSEIGLQIGQAFQIQDDVIGIFDSEKNIGKSILSDLAESKKTLLVAHAYAHLKGKDKQKFLSIFNKPHKTYADLLSIRTIFIQAGSLTYCLEGIRVRLQKALRLLNKLQIKDKEKKVVHGIFSNIFCSSHKISQHYNQSLN